MIDRFLTDQGDCRIEQSILSGYGNVHKTLSYFLCTFLKFRVRFRRKRLSIVITFKSLSPSHIDRKTKKKWLFMITRNLRYSILIPVREQCNSTFTNPALCLTISKTSVIFCANSPTIFSCNHFRPLIPSTHFNPNFFPSRLSFNSLFFPGSGERWRWAREAHFKRTRIPLSVFHCKSVMFIQKLSSPL